MALAVPMSLSQQKKLARLLHGLLLWTLTYSAHHADTPQLHREGGIMFHYSQSIAKSAGKDFGDGSIVPFE